MTENEIRDAYLDLFQIHGADPSLLEKLRPLRDEALQADLTTWVQIIDARIARTEERFDDALDILNVLLQRESDNIYALLYKSALLGFGLDRYEEALSVSERLIGALDTATDPASRRVLAKAMLYEGFYLRGMERPDDALASDEAVIDRFGEATELPLRWEIANAMANKGIDLSEMDRQNEALAAYEAVIEQFGEVTDLSLCEAVPMAMVNTGVVLGEMDRPDEALAAYDAVIKRFGEATEWGPRKLVALAMVNKGVDLSRMDRHDDALAAYEAVIERFKEATELSLRKQVARAMVNKGVDLSRMDRHDDALAAYEAVIERFKEATELPLRAQVGLALGLKAWDFERNGKTAEALTGYDKAIAYLGDAKDESVRNIQTFVTGARAALLARERAPEADEATKRAVDVRKGQYSDTLQLYLRLALQHFNKKTRDEYFEKMDQARRRTDSFLANESRFALGASFLLVLREWNSYTPALPAEEEADRGGGYFIRHDGQGIVVDPGYDFIDNLYRAGGNLCDIDHIVVTHAHDDHTAQLESLLMLLHQRNKDKDKGDKQRIRLYMSQGCQRKFSRSCPFCETDVA